MNYSLFETEKNNPLQDHDTDGQYNALATETCTFASPNGNSSSDSGDIDAAVNTISNGLHTNQSPVQFAGAIDTVQSSLGNRATMHLAGEQLQQNIHGIAQTGFRDAAGSYPFQEQIQQSFGAKHDISSLSAHTGPAARSANAEFGSDAYHQGGNVAFAGEPTLHDAAHEAAHYVQNVGTTQLAGGVGTPNDCYEQHADKVADGVAQGQDVSGLLDQIPGATQAQAPVGGAEAPVQMAGEGVVSRLGKLGRRSIMSNLGMGSMGMGQRKYHVKIGDYSKQFGDPTVTGVVNDLSEQQRHTSMDLLQSSVGQQHRWTAIPEKSTPTTLSQSTHDEKYLEQLMDPSARSNFNCSHIPAVFSARAKGDPSLLSGFQDIINTNTTWKVTRDGYRGNLNQSEVINGLIGQGVLRPYDPKKDYKKGSIGFLLSPDGASGYPLTPDYIDEWTGEKKKNEDIDKEWENVKVSHVVMFTGEGNKTIGFPDFNLTNKDTPSNSADSTIHQSTFDEELAFYNKLSGIPNQDMWMVWSEGFVYEPGDFMTSTESPFQRTRSSRPWVRPSMDLGDKGTYPFKMPDEEQKVKNHSRYLDRRPGVYDMVPYSGGKQVSTIPPRQFPQGNRQFFQNHDDIMFFLDMLQNRVGQNKGAYHPFMDICDYPYGWWEAVMAHSRPEVLEENLARIQHQQDYKGIQAQPGFADFYRHLTINQHGQQCDFVHQSVSVSMGDKTLHNHLIPDFRQLVEKDKLGNPILDKKGKPKRRDIIPKPTTGMYGLNPESGYAIGPPGGVGDSDFPFMNSIIEPYTGGPTKYSGSDRELAQYHGDTIQGSNPGIEKWPPLVRFSGIPLSNPLDALIYYELSRNARTGIYDVRDKACPQFSLGMLNMGGANMGEILPSSSGGDISASDPGKNVSSLNPGITRELDNYLAHNTTHHFDPTLLASLRDQNASVTDKEGNQLPLNFPNQLPISPFDLYVDFTKPWLLPKDAPWPWHGEIYQKYYEEWLRNQT